MASAHIIRRQFLDVEFDGSESEAIALQNRLLALCQDELGPALERVFDRLAPPREHWTIDHLNIDAGSVPPDDLERLVDAITEAVERQLRQTPTEGNRRFEPPTGRIDGLASPIHLRTQAQSVQQAFLYFLENGVLPWWVQLPTGKTLEEVIRELWQRGDTDEGRPAHFAGALRGRIHSASLRRRLIRQFSFDFLNIILASVSEESAAAVRELSQELERQSLAEKAPPEFLEAVWNSAFLIAFAGRRATPGMLVATSLTTLRPTTDDVQFSKLVTADRQGEIAKPKPLREVIEATSSLGLTEGIFAPCAGIVLLHPFLFRFFESLGVADKDTLLQPDRALCLLHYLATGQRFAPEYELLIAKVLCNLPLDSPVGARFDMTSVEEEECAALLEAVIRHWSALANSSVENVRGSFLVRPGKLSQRDGEYLLQVNTRSYDVLLDQLPWSLGLVKLPWMQKTLWVEWRF